MAQQINLSTPILLTQKRYFSAHTMLVALSVFVVLGGLGCAIWVWNFQQSMDSMNETLKAQSSELDKLRLAIANNRSMTKQPTAALQTELQQLQAVVSQREKLQQILQEGVLPAGSRYSDRLDWIARSIPAVVWITGIKMDGTHFDVSGYTLEPAALTEWRSKLAQSSLMQGMELAAIKVENAHHIGGRERWSFHLSNAVVKENPALPKETPKEKKP